MARSQESVPIPSHVHWDLFLGTAPERPYNPIYHPHNWRGWWDFGTGSLGDMACHTTNLPFMAARLMGCHDAGLGQERGDQPGDVPRVGDGGTPMNSPRAVNCRR